MNRGYIRSSPRFFRLIRRSLSVFAMAVLLLGLVIPAPLQEQADIARVPNPVKSAWFLLWIQELVSYSKYLINLVLLSAVALFLLPWLPLSGPSEKARWLPPDQRAVSTATLSLFSVILLLTILAMFFRGANWSLQFVLP
ncbi:selenite/tellurite reduction operon b-type cytochrome membrane protein ExtQ [Geobacter sp. DSM 9736]|uniref:selenite/tellurite reduction operon b-type cytochrome membrane protein ExtQ n=1 Tax=Geobacter sp. DSM 9736 TaxID=1277350 RepID=UPI000B503081|nr:selenite/tellurite reduction operon b-type cytochrome membrane protein ExtQ [Geobacter sp. DSM 9736]SNB44800.1 hypothetical protein SAMN06269301_0187 [Geobacter sp. DSM 9736]